jgi:hypothetical protein
LSNDAQKSKVDSDLANRLDTLFDEDEQGEKPVAPAGHSKDPLDELKSLVMSIEWEITDDVMERFLSQIDSLKTRFGEDRILIMFLQLLGSLGLYVKTNKGKAHPIAFKLLNSVYTSFESAASPGKISPSEKKKLLYVELNKYKELKEQIESSRGPAVEPERTPAMAAGKMDDFQREKVPAGETPAVDSTPANDGTITRAYLDERLDHLKSLILKELAAIREDIAQLAKAK